MTRRRSLGAQLAWQVALATAAGIASFTAVAATVVWLDERLEVDEPGVAAPDDDEEDEALAEVVEDLGLAVVLATPVGLAVAVGAARRSARRLAARLDGLVATASRMTATDLRAPLPRSPHDDELDRLAAAFDRTFARIDDGVAALRRFAADASHELRTPLAVLINQLEVARRRPRDAAAWEGVADRALADLREMADQIEALLQGARAGAFDLAAEPLELDAAVEALAARWREPATAAGVALQVELGAAAEVAVDPRALAIAAGNLVRNAIAHSPRGAAVTLRTARRAERARLEVDDQGPGVPPAERERIFAPFARGDAAAAREDRPGAGLGLAIARRIVQAHGGAIEVDDAPGGGARFAIELPLAPPS